MVHAGWLVSAMSGALTHHLQETIMTTLAIKDLARMEGLETLTMRSIAGGVLYHPIVSFIPPELERWLPKDLPWPVKPVDPRYF